MPSKTMWVAGLCWALLGLGAVHAQAAPPTDGGEVAPVVVTAQPAPSEEALKQFARAAAVLASERQLARWDRSVCPVALGLSARHNTFLARKVADAAKQAGLKPPRPTCRPNVVILVSDDADRLVQLMAEQRAFVFAAKYRGQIRSFVATPRPVRMWHSSRAYGVNGAAENVFGEGSQGAVIKGVDTRLRPNVVQSFERVVLVVDTKRANGVNFGALGDYLAMAALAQLDPEADLSGSPTILNLFRARAEGRAAPQRLSAWDKAYLRSLYATDANVRGRRQQAAMAKHMAKTLAKPEAEVPTTPTR